MAINRAEQNWPDTYDISEFLAKSEREYNWLAERELAILAQGHNMNNAMDLKEQAAFAWPFFHHFGPLAKQHRRDCQPCWKHKTFQDF